MLLLLALLLQDGTISLTARSTENALAWAEKGARVQLLVTTLPSDDELKRLAAKGIVVIVDSTSHDEVCRRLDAGCDVPIAADAFTAEEMRALGGRKGRVICCVKTVAEARAIAGPVWICSDRLTIDDLRSLGRGITADWAVSDVRALLER